MPEITFEVARNMTSASQKWLKDVSNFIQDPVKSPTPTDLYPTQKLAFEIDKDEIKKLLDAERIVGILCKEFDSNTLSFILVGVDKEGRPTNALRPRETWPKLNDMSQVDFVMNTYLTP